MRVDSWTIGHSISGVNWQVFECILRVECVRLIEGIDRSIFFFVQLIQMSTYLPLALA